MTGPVLVEPVGRAWLKYWASQDLGGDGEEKAAVKKQEDDDRSYEIADDVDFEDYYGLLGLTDLGYHATTEDIRRAYKKISMKYHPDKQTAKTSKEYAENRYKAIQRAWDVLQDKERKLHYDSARDFDDSIPDSGVDEADFFDEYGPVFERWSRFSTKPAPPTLGDESTSEADLLAFYEYWYTFQSWRDFSYEGEHDYETAENRMEKRWMQKENSSVAKKFKKEELQKVRSLVKRAERADPRMIKIRKREEIERKVKEAQKAKEKAEKEAAKQAKIAEERRQAEEAKKAEDRERQKKERTEQRKRREQEKGRSSIRAMVLKPPFDSLIEKDKQNEFVRDVGLANHDEVKALVDAMKPLAADPGRKKDKPLLKAFKSAYKTLRKRLKAMRQKHKEEEEARLKAKMTMSSGKPWDEKELKLLTEAIRKFPGGTVDRWGKIAKYLGTNRTDKEVVSKVKDMAKMSRVRAKPAASEKSASTVPKWTTDDQRALEKALKETKAIKGPERWDRIAKMVPGHDRQSCLDRFNFIKAQILARRKAAGK